MSSQKPNYLRTAMKQAGPMDSPIEAKFALDARALNFPPWERNYVFIEGRRLEIDFAWPIYRFGVEVDGAVHRITDRFHRDREKDAQALLHGWTILRVTGRQVRSGEGINWARTLLFRLIDGRNTQCSTSHFPASDTHVCQCAPNRLSESSVGKG